MNSHSLFLAANLVVRKGLLLNSIVKLQHSLSLRFAQQSNSANRSSNSARRQQWSSLKTHDCGTLRLKHVGSNVILRGFLHFSRMETFGVLRDHKGSVQFVIPSVNKQLKSVFKSFNLESYIEISGEVIPRPDKMQNKSMETGDIEISVNSLKLISSPKHPLPFKIIEKEQETHQYRYLELRFRKLQENLVFKSDLKFKITEFLVKHLGFREVTTPTLSSYSPGGAQEFIVPTQIQNHCYSLVQSPQLYKQMLMIAGFDKYFQFATCYRDESGTSNRQPEFLQLDLEMMDCTSQDIMNITENIIRNSWPEGYPDLPQSFDTISYSEAMESYGSDKPDTRFSWKLHDIAVLIREYSNKLFPETVKESHYIKSFVIPSGEHQVKEGDKNLWKKLVRLEFSLKNVEYLIIREDFSLEKSGDVTIPGTIGKQVCEQINASKGDLIVLASDSNYKTTVSALGKLRLEAAKVLEVSGIPVRDPNVFSFLWVTDFPLFEIEDGVLKACHHPFTAPIDEHEQLIYEDPLKVTSQHYDLVLNGCEVGGGSIRIHNGDLQDYVLRKVLNIKTGLEFFVNAFNYGVPPHGGIALGFDRYVSLLRHESSIRHVIAFPKTLTGHCRTTNSPSYISDADRSTYITPFFKK